MFGNFCLNPILLPSLLVLKCSDKSKCKLIFFQTKIPLKTCEFQIISEWPRNTYWSGIMGNCLRPSKITWSIYQHSKLYVLDKRTIGIVMRTNNKYPSSIVVFLFILIIKIHVVIFVRCSVYLVFVQSKTSRCPLPCLRPSFGRLVAS
jgi:hypothetical protein